MREHVADVFGVPASRVTAIPNGIDPTDLHQCIVADTGGLRDVVPGGRRVGLRFRARDPRSPARMAERLLSDDALRDRLVAEAGEWVLRFDWADTARQTAAVYGSLRGARVS